MLNYPNILSQIKKLEALDLIDNISFKAYCDKWAVEGMSSDKIRLVVSSWKEALDLINNG